MRTPGHDFELAAGWLVHEGLTTAPPRTIAYCTDTDLTPEQEFNVVTVTLDEPPTRDPGHRHAGSGSSACGVCGKDTIAEALAAPAAGRWTGPVPAPDVVRTLPDRLREAQASSTPPAVSMPRRWPRPRVSCSSSARTSGGTTPSTR